MVVKYSGRGGGGAGVVGPGDFKAFISSGNARTLEKSLTASS